MNGNGFPTWVKGGAVGIISFLLMFLLGAIPGMPSPLIQIRDEIRAHAQESRMDTAVVRRAAVGTCHGIWKEEGDTIRNIKCGILAP